MINTVIRKVAIVLVLIMVLTPTGVKSSLKVRGAAFIPMGVRFKDVYGSVVSNVQIEAATRVCKCLELWGNVDWFVKSGQSIGLRSFSHIDTINVSFGVKLPYKFSDCWLMYVGVGPSIGRIELKNFLPTGSERVLKGAVGAVVKTGLYCHLNKHIFIDFFVDYLHQPVRFQSTVQIGGFKVGTGLGLTF